jgi:hypothetical protein
MTRAKGPRIDLQTEGLPLRWVAYISGGKRRVESTKSAGPSGVWSTDLRPDWPRIVVRPERSRRMLGRFSYRPAGC